jgi:hypothetical protein
LAGWQGTLRVCTNIDVTANPGATVRFSTSRVDALGAPVALDTSGCAEIATATVSEGNAVVIAATTSPIGGLIGQATLTLRVDVTPPAQPTSLAATVKARRQTTFRLAWTAPADGTASVSGYDVRVSKALIDTADKFAAAESVAYTSTPPAAGAQDGIDVPDRIIENDYYFAVVATDAVGNPSPMAYTTSAARATFNTVQLVSSVANEQMGWRVDGSTDLTGDGRSDLIVGAYAGLNAYVYFGSPTGYPTTPSLTIMGSAVGFGGAVSAVGDINGDGLPDIAVSSPHDGDGKVFVFYGRSSWPATLGENQADVVIDVDSTADPGFASRAFGSTLAALGDFDGDDIDDFAIGTPYYDNNHGHLAVVFGAAGGLPPQVVLPAAYGTRALAFLGSTSLEGYFGYAVLGLPGFYAGGSTLIVGTSPSNSGGLVYAWRGRGAQAAPLSFSSADSSLTGSGAGTVGSWAVVPLRNLTGLSLPAVAFGVPDAASGAVRAWSGTATSGPFAQQIMNLDDAGATAGLSFGAFLATGAFSGQTATVSYLGDSTPDLATGSIARSGLPARLFIVNGTRLAALGSAGTDIATVADVVYPLPSGWTNFTYFDVALRDLDGDGYGDLAIPEFDYSNPFNGRILVLW